MTYGKMQSTELAEKVLQQEPLFILDVRKREAFEEWKIEGRSFSYVNKPYSEWMDNVDEILPQLPKDSMILIVCAKGKTAVKAAQTLTDAGVENVYLLSGGMQAWSEHLQPVQVGELENGGVIYQFVRLGKGCLSYLIISGEEAAVIDPARMTEVYDDFAKAKGASIKQVMDTHLHADHISGSRVIAANSGAKYWFPPKDAEEVEFSYEPLQHGRSVQVGHSHIQVEAVYSPGHTIGSTSLIVDNRYLLSGDILFIDSIGRPDLAGKAEEWAKDLRETLYERYAQLDQALQVLPAHFASLEEMNDDGSIEKSLSQLYAQNQGLQIADEDEFIAKVTENLPPQPNDHQEIRRTNMGLSQPDDEQQSEMETGPNRCAVS